MTLLDTGPLVALLERRDAHHSWAIAAMRAVRRPLVTCEAALSESCFLLGSLPRARLQLRLWIQSGFIGHRSLDTLTVERGLRLMERYATVPMSFADACLVAWAERTPETQIFTLDRHFLIYRQAGDQPLTLIAPFGA